MPEYSLLRPFQTMDEEGAGEQTTAGKTLTALFTLFTSP
jgi:hypothetical protein